MTGFSDERRQHIRERLLDSGRRNFARYGLDKTTIAELTDPVDIAPSTFYQFFDSKELFYLEVLETETERFYDRATAPLEGANDPERAIRGYLEIAFEEVETNPLVEGLFTDDEFERLLALYSDDDLATQRDRELGYLVPYVEAWQESGAIRAGDPEAIAATIDAPILLAVYRDEFGAELYPVVRDLLIETVAAGITETETNDRTDLSSRDSRPET